MSESTVSKPERRRSPRFTCGGHAGITRLPSDGPVQPGSLRDLSLHGCCVDLPLPMDCGMRAELVVRVNAASFRAVTEVRALRAPSVAGMEFVHLSAGGRDMLAELVADLAKLQALIQRLNAARFEMDEEFVRRQMELGKLQANALGEHIQLLERLLNAENLRRYSASEEAEPNQKETGVIVQPAPLIIAVDLII